jgi:hypothetical protein
MVKPWQKGRPLFHFFIELACVIARASGRHLPDEQGRSQGAAHNKR